MGEKKSFLVRFDAWIVFLIFGGAMAAWAVGFGNMLRKDIDHKAFLMKQCMDDGHKEYECVAMLKEK